jgi:hypothetical protein
MNPDAPIPTDLDHNGTTDARDLDLALCRQDEASGDYRGETRRAMRDGVITAQERSRILLAGARDREAANTVAAVTIALAHVHAQAQAQVA